MSLYEALAVVALLAAGGYAYRLYRSDTKPGATTVRPENEGQSMFGRDRGPKR
jgi:hypothetical protein